MAEEAADEIWVRWFRNHWKEIEALARFGPGASAAVREMTVGILSTNG